MMLELRDINKTYLQGKLEVPVLNGISLSVEEGEYLAIMGPSGSGKTTLMNIIGCLDNPSSGEYILEGEDIAQVSEKRMSEVRLHSIGFVFQSFYLLSRQSAIDNVALPLLYAGVRRRERMEIARKALERVGLGDRVDFKPTQLSGGQCQRVAIARAIVNSPKILLADEPTGALDTKSGEQIMEIFRRLNEEGVTIVMITHEPEIAAHAKRTLHIRDGLLVDSAGRRPEKPAPAPACAGAEPVRMPRPLPPIAPRPAGSGEAGTAAPAGKPASQKLGAQANPPAEGRPPKNAGSRPGPRPVGTGQGKPAPQQGKKPDAEPAQLYSRLEPRQRPPREKQEPGRKPQPRRPENPQAPGGQARDSRPKAPRPQEQKLQEHKLQERKPQEQKLLERKPQEGSLPEEKSPEKSRPHNPSKAQPAPEDQPLRGQNPPRGENVGEAGEDKSLNQPISGKSIIEALERQLKKLSEERDGTPENREESSDEQ